MATQIAPYQCPNCTAPLQFDSESGKLKCEFCDSSYFVEDIEEAAAGSVSVDETSETPWDASELSDDWGKDAKQMKRYSCPSCGAELICHAQTAATSCPYCGNNTIVASQLSGALKPDYVIPFKVSKEEAIAALKAHYKDKPYLPKTFSDENVIQEIKGVYVPFWLFSGKGVGDATYEAVRVETTTIGDRETTESYHYHVRRAGMVRFANIPVDASTIMDDAYMESLEPYHFGELQPFSMSYLPGFFADTYDVNADECFARADERARNTVSEALMTSASSKYTSCIPVNEEIKLQRGKVQYALLPVWILNTKWTDGEDGRRFACEQREASG